MPQLGLGLGLHRANRALFRGLLDQYAGAAAAYSLRALSSGWRANNVVEVRRSSDSTSQDFTASQITNGDLVSFVNNSTWTSAENSTSQPYTTFTGASLSGFTATLSAGVAFGGFGGVSGVSGQTVSVSFDLVINSGSPSLALRTSRALINTRSNSIVFSESGSYTADLNATDTFGFIGFSEGDNPSDFTISNFEVTGVSGEDGFVSTWYDQSGNGNDATQITTTAQPKIVSAGALVTGGLDFDGVNDDLDANGLSAAFQSKSYAAIFAVVKYDSTASATEPVFFAQAGAALGSARVYVGKVGTNFSSAGRRLDADSFVQSTFASSTSSVLLTSMDQWADGDTQLVVNGSEKTAANYSSGAGVTSNTTSNVVTIGSLATNFMGGAINELIIYNTDQSANRVAIETNINAAYSIYA